MLRVARFVYLFLMLMEDLFAWLGATSRLLKTVISGMGELHLDIYVERLEREYKVKADVGKPRVNFRETVTQRADFDYLYKKQSGGQGQCGRVCGGSLIGYPVESIRIVLTDGASHAVDSSELAFKLAAIYAFRKFPPNTKGPFLGTNKQKGMIVGNDQDGDDSVITAHVRLSNMFGYSTAL